MIKLHELKAGDIVLTEFEGQRSEGEVVEISREQGEALLRTAVQDFWFEPDHLFPIPLTEDQLFKFEFEKQEMEGGKIKYLKGPFRILLSQNGNFSDFEMWYREDRRHITREIMVHELQNHYHQMTKVDLVREPAVKAG